MNVTEVQIKHETFEGLWMYTNFKQELEIEHGLFSYIKKTIFNTEEYVKVLWSKILIQLWQVILSQYDEF